MRTSCPVSASSKKKDEVKSPFFTIICGPLGKTRVDSNREINVRMMLLLLKSEDTIWRPKLPLAWIEMSLVTTCKERENYYSNDGDFIWSVFCHSVRFKLASVPDVVNTSLETINQRWGKVKTMLKHRVLYARGQNIDSRRMLLCLSDHSRYVVAGCRRI